MAEQVMGILLNHGVAAKCVSECIEAGVFNREIGLITRHSVEEEIEPLSTGIFQKNGDVSTAGGSAVASGLIGSIIGTAIGVATFTIPGLGLFIGVGPVVSAVCGGALGALFGREMGKSMDDLYTEKNPLHPYILALKAGEVLCSVTVEPDIKEEISRIMSKYASKRIFPKISHGYSSSWSLRT